VVQFTLKNYFMQKYKLILFLTACTTFCSCERTTELLDENIRFQYSDTSANASVKFINAFPSLTPALTANAGPSVVIFMDGKKLNGTTSAAANAFIYNSTFPVNTSYSLLPALNHTFHFIMNRYTAGVFAPASGDTVFRAASTLAAGKKYSFFLVDTVQNPGVLIKEDNWTVPQQDKYQVRYANLVANPNERVDVFSIRQNANIFTNVGYKEIANYVELPVPAIADSLIIRFAGTMNVRDTLKAFFPTPQRVYTWYSRGKTGITGRTPATTFVSNR
jgi:Domain of unknown function (DUF4397)